MPTSILLWKMLQKKYDFRLSRKVFGKDSYIKGNNGTQNKSWLPLGTGKDNGKVCITEDSNEKFCWVWAQGTL